MNAMKKIVLLVEGSKDAYFLHELLLRRFADSFNRQENPIESEKPKTPVRMRSKNGEVEVELHWTDGYSKIGGLKNVLKRPSEMEDNCKFASGIIFDSDVPPVTGKNMNHAGQEARRKEIVRSLCIDAPYPIERSKEWLFLFPDNQSDGDLEDVLRQTVRASAEHEKFFSACWFPFVKSVEGIPAHRPTDKSMMNEYKAAFNSDAWKINGQNRCYADESLWDWNAKVLEPLVAFLDCVMNDDAVENLGDLLK